MRYAYALEPVSADEPCGEDLDLAGDDQYLSYVLSADFRFPDRFYDADSGSPFDKSSIDLKAETQAIDKILQDTRDLRVLSLAARFHVLAGDLVNFCSAVVAMGGLIDRYWETVHPRPQDGDFAERQNAVETLESRPSVILPLQYAHVAKDRRAGQIVLRHYQIATGSAAAREDEAGPDATAIMDALASPDNAEEVEKSHEAVIAAAAALQRAREVFIEAAGHDHTLHCDTVVETLGEIRALIEQARPDLRDDANIADTGTDVPDTEGEVAAQDAGDQPDAPGGTAGSATIASFADAKAALDATERYFVAVEPSNPALILIHQARVLIGRPLVEALQVLMPGLADEARIKVRPDLEFQIDMGRMREITSEALESHGPNGADPDAGDCGNTFSAVRRADAILLMQGVEGFFRAQEPSSPVPILLEKARGYIARDFNAILKDIVQSQEKTDD